MEKLKQTLLTALWIGLAIVFYPIVHRSPIDEALDEIRPRNLK